MRKSLFFAILMFLPMLLPFRAMASDVVLSWNASANCTMCQYNIWRGTMTGGPYTKINAVPVLGTTYTDKNVTPGTYFYIASSFFPGGTGATLNVTAVNGAVTAVAIRTAGSGYTNLVGQCPACGLVFQERQSGPFSDGNISGGFFPITAGGGSGANAFCTNATSSNGVADSIQSCFANGTQSLLTDPIGGSGYASSFIQPVPTDSWDSEVAFPGSLGGSNEVRIVVTLKPSAPGVSGIW